MKTFQNWVTHFTHNQPYVAWKDDYKLSDTEHRAVYKSLRVFQKGESSEAKNLLAKAKDFVKDKEDKSYYDALVVFIREENRHSFELGKFMDMQNIPCLQVHWEDNLFRSLRKLGNLEGSITVLLTAEIMASVFYDALHACTKSNVLKQICTNILIDEDKHVAFQSIGLAQFYRKRNFLQRQFCHASRAFFLSGSILLVWFLHHKIFKHGGYSFSRFFHDSFTIFERTVSVIEYECAQDKVRLPEFAII